VYVASANTDAAARRARPSRHVPAVRNPSATANDESPHGSASELPPATSHGYVEWDISGVPDPVMFRRFLDATNYWFGYYDNLSAGSYNPARECFVVLTNDQANAANAAEAATERFPRPGNWTAPGRGAKRATPLTTEEGRHQRAASSSARARSQACGGTPCGAATSRLHRRGSFRAW
jgi:hypothetical protein